MRLESYQQKKLESTAGIVETPVAPADQSIKSKQGGRAKSYGSGSTNRSRTSSRGRNKT